MKILKLKLFTRLTMMFIFIGAVVANGQETEEADPVTWDTYWSNGYNVESSDGNFKLGFGGRVMFDGVGTVSYDDSLEAFAGDAGNGTTFRRVRFFNDGTVYGNISYKLQLDFAGSSASFSDVYIQINEIPVLNYLRAGHFKEPFGLEELTSSKYISLIERSLTSPFAPSRNAGIMSGNSLFDGRMNWAAGLFRDADGAGQAHGDWDSNLNFTGRITGTPYVNEEGDQLLHLGLAYRRVNPAEGSLSYSSGPEVRLQPSFANTGQIENINNGNVIGTELATVFNRFSLQGEYMRSDISRDIELTSNNGETREKTIDSDFSAFYVKGSAFLTSGDRRAYSSGSFGRVRPNRNFGENGGIGALEIAMRYSRLDLIDGESEISEDGFSGSSLIAGGIVDNVSTGINWYLNPVARVMVNYVHSGVTNSGGIDDPDEIADIGNGGFIQSRIQIDF